MSLDFHRDMSRYLASKRRKRLFSNFKARVMNKKAVLSYKAGSKFDRLKGKLTSKVEEIKKRKEEPKIKILEEKQRIEEERLDELRKARKKEQMEVLRGRVMNILFKKKPKIKRDIGEEVRKEIRTEAKKNFAKQNSFKSFFSKFIQIRTAAEIEREEKERLKKEEEQAVKDQLEINKMLQQGKEEAISNVLSKEQNVNILATLFPGENKSNIQQMKNQEDVIELDQGYKIRVVKNK